MNCDRWNEILSLSDDNARVDLIGLERHLTHCPSCRAAHPDLVWLIAAHPAIESPANRRPAIRYAVAATLLVGVTLGLTTRTSLPPPSTSSPELKRTVVRVESILETTVVSYRRPNRTATDTTTHSIVSPNGNRPRVRSYR